MTELARRHRDRVIAAIAAAALLLAAFILLTPAPRASAQPECATAIDLMLVVDGSESIRSGDFNLTRAFASSVIGYFTISPADAHVGIVQFAGEAQGRIERGLSSDPAAIEGAISAMAQIVGATDIQEGIALAQAELTAGGRSSVPHVIIVLTDGEHNQPGDPIAEATQARSLGTEIFAIAVGPGPNAAELNAIASDPDSEHVFSVSAFDALVTILDPLVQVVCPPTPTQMPPADETAAPPGTPGPAQLDDVVLGVVRLPETGSHNLALDWGHRANVLMVQALGGLGGALCLVAATYWIGRRRARQ